MDVLAHVSLAPVELDPELGDRLVLLRTFLTSYTNH